MGAPPAGVGAVVVSLVTGLVADALMGRDDDARN
jgi:hypothetical protein